MCFIIIIRCTLTALLFLREFNLLCSNKAVVTPTKRTVVNVYLILVFSLVEVSFCGSCLPYARSVGYPKV